MSSLEDAETTAAVASVEKMDLEDDNGNVERERAAAPSKDDTDLKPPPSLERDDDNKSNDDDMIDDSSSTSTDDDSGDDVITTEKADEKLLLATQLKEEGNGHFQQKDFDKAARAYRRGCNALKPLRKTRSEDEQVNGLLVALQSNLCMVSIQQKKYAVCIQVATQALSLDATNVKVLYRRALAQRRTGHLEEARADLRQALQLDPNNKQCKKELAAVKKELETTRESQKKALAKAFSSRDGSFLYNDREAAEKKREEAARQKKLQEQELYKKRKVEWEDECVHRMARNEPAISFEDWEKARKEGEEKKRKKEKKRREEEEARAKEARRKAKELERLQRKDESETSDDDELTKEELEMMRGYKKTSDGRTTSYFNRELSDDAKRVIGDIAPKRLDKSPSTSDTPTRLPSSTSVGTSAWNKAGTWEEKDTTAWCSSQLRKRLEATSVTANLEADITKVQDLTGDASVALTGGKKRYIFDFHVSLKYEIKDPNADNVIAGGVVRLPDICSTHHEELEVAFESWSKKPSVEAEAKALEMRSLLARELRTAVTLWVREFNEQY